MKKALNAAEANGTLIQGPGMVSQGFAHPNTPDSLPPSGPPPMLASNVSMGPQQLHPDAMSMPGVGMDGQLYHFQPFMVPSVMQHPHPHGHDNPAFTGQELMGGVSTSAMGFDHPALTTDPSADHNYSLASFPAYNGSFDLGGQFPDLTVSEFHGSNASSHEGISNSASPGDASHSGANGNNTGHTTFMPLNWSSDKALDNNSPREGSPRDPLDATGTPADVHPTPSIHAGDGQWAQGSMAELFGQEEVYLGGPSHAPSLSSTATDEDGARRSMAMELAEMPSEMYSRRNSSTTALAEGISAVDIQNRPEPNLKKQNPPMMSLAARRQRPRPAALNSMPLRSASQSGGVPGSPGCLTAPPDHSLRRIKSNGVSRITKPLNSASGQRSPLHFAYENAFLNASCSGLSTPSVSATASSSLAPPTPLSPTGFSMSERSHFQHALMQSYGMDKNNGQTFMGQGSNDLSSFSSPPTTPFEADQITQFRNLQMQQAQLRFTPPQSAPATQLTFSRGSLVTEPPIMESPGMNGDQSRHFRRPSLPIGAVSSPEAAFATPPVPLFPGVIPNEFPFGMPAEFLPKTETEDAMKRPELQSPSPFNLGTQHAVLRPDFFTQEPTPPSNTPPHGAGETPKQYEFSHQGPEDFGVE
jgi:hypothetical protein